MLAQLKYNVERCTYLTFINILKKLKAQIYRRHFIIKTNTLILIKLINKRTINVLGALITYQITPIYLFNFNIICILKKSNIVVDVLSIKPTIDLDNPKV